MQSCYECAEDSELINPGFNCECSCHPQPRKKKNSKSMDGREQKSKLLNILSDGRISSYETNP